MVIKTAWYWPENKCMGKWDKYKPEINLHVYNQFTFKKVKKIHGKMIFSGLEGRVSS